MDKWPEDLFSKLTEYFSNKVTQSLCFYADRRGLAEEHSDNYDNDVRLIDKDQGENAREALKYQQGLFQVLHGVFDEHSVKIVMGILDNSQLQKQLH